MGVQFQSTVPTNNKLKDLLHRGGREEIEGKIRQAVLACYSAVEGCPISKDNLILSSRDKESGKPTDKATQDTIMGRFVKWLSEKIHNNRTHYSDGEAGQSGRGAPVSGVA